MTTTDEHVISTHALTKRYGDTIVAVDELALRVRRGEVYGFLGPNGAGKTTTLRMLVGLVRPTSGEATVLGAPPGARAGLARIGAMIEQPAFYPYLSGRDNLRVLARHAGVEEPRVRSVLDQVGLSSRATDRSATYSMGMKQRLGVAAALLKDPELLILDEPTNGLDPAGMAEMRDFIRSLADGGRTVLLSSHLMGEIEQVSDRVGRHPRRCARRRGHRRRAARPGGAAGARHAAGAGGAADRRTARGRAGDPQRRPARGRRRHRAGRGDQPDARAGRRRRRGDLRTDRIARGRLPRAHRDQREQEGS